MRLDNWVVPLHLVFENLALMELMNALGLSTLEHVRLVQIVRFLLFLLHCVLLDRHQASALNNVFVALLLCSHLVRIDSFDDETSELVPFHGAVSIDIDFIKEVAQSIDEVVLFELLVVGNDDLHEFDELEKCQAIVVMLNLLSEPVLDHLQLERRELGHDVVDGEFVANLLVRMNFGHSMLQLSVESMSRCI